MGHRFNWSLLCCVGLSLLLVESPKCSASSYYGRYLIRSPFLTSAFSVPSENKNVVTKPQPKLSPRYTIVASSDIRPNSSYRLSVHWTNATSPVAVLVKVLGTVNNVTRTSDVTSFRVMPNDRRFVSLNIGQLTMEKYTLQIKGYSSELDFSREHQLTNKPERNLIFVQTDKATYKPGQIVKLRAIVLKSDLVPVANMSINILIKDSSDNLIKRWNNVLLEKGVASRELQLSEQPPLGDWSILIQISDAQDFAKKFKVAEYVLPTFSVDVQLPKYITINQTEIIVTVQAMYTFGKPVKGQVTLTVAFPPTNGFDELDEQKFQTKVKLTNSTVDIPIKLDRDLKIPDYVFAFLKNKHYNKNARESLELSFHAAVEEELTGRVYNRTETIKMYDSAFKIELLDSTHLLKPGLPYAIKFKVAYMDDTPVEDDGPEVHIVYEFADNEKRWNTTIKQVPQKGLIQATIYSPKGSSYRGLRAEYLGKKYTIGHYELNIAESASDSFIQVSVKNDQTGSTVQPKIFAVGQIATFQINCTEPIQQLIYQVQLKGVTVLVKTKRLHTPRSTFEFSLKITDQMAPTARLLVFYVRAANSELVADSMDINVNDGGLFKTPVRLSSNVNETKPGGLVDITVRTNPEALVGLLGVDQSVLLLQSGNDITRKLVREQVETANRATQTQSHSNQIYHIFGNSGLTILTNEPAKPVILYHDYEDDELEHSSEGSGEEADHCPGCKLNFVASAAADVHDSPVPKRSKSTPIKLRKEFPETWIWSNISSASNGIVKYSDRIPDTITSWYVSAFAIDSISGLGIAEESLKINVFRPFFVKLSLPYSIIRGETVTIQALVFNYQSKPVQAEVEMENAKDEFSFTTSDNEIEDIQVKRATIMIPSSDSVAVKFVITPKVLGNIDIKVQATTDNAGDAIVRKLLVKPEGQTQYFNEARFIQLYNQTSNEKTIKHNITIDIPPNAVPGSVRVMVSGSSDILATTINNFDDLLRMPYGCGEQNMINFVPNIVVLNYLTKSKRLTSAIESKAMKHIETGYQRELTYQRTDGSFSVFGNSDDEGSTWLTAYVVKSFLQARPYIEVDHSVISRAIEFLFSRQLNDGSFEERGRLLDKKMQGGASHASGTITAYVLSAILLEQKSTMYNDRITKAQEFILNCLTDSTDPYEIAIITYALHLGNTTKKQKDSAFTKLMSLAKKETTHRIYWTREYTSYNAKPKQRYSEYLTLPNALDVETTAYGLLTLVARSELGDGVRVLRWLISKQNSNGGFASTQDTVIGLQALGAIAEQIINSPNLDMTVSIQDSNGPKDSSQSIHFNSDNVLVLQQRELGSEPRWVELRASGIGSALVQVSYQYNIAESAEKSAFFLSPQISNASTENNLVLDICTFYTKGDSTNMALMEIELPSGYNADMDTLRESLLSTEVKRVDSGNNDDTVFVYLDEVTPKRLCITVPAHRTHHVSNLKPVPVTIFDYYDRSKLSRTFYSPQ